MSVDPAAEQIAQRGLQELRRRLNAAIADQAAQEPSGLTLAPAEIDELVTGAAQRAGAALWRRSLAQAGSELLGIPLREAIAHPAVRHAHEIVGAPPYDGDGAIPEARTTAPPPVPAPAPAAAAPPASPTPPAAAPPAAPTPPAASDAGLSEGAATVAPGALRVEAVHMGGIDSLRVGERDLEVRLSAEGIDVLKRSSGAAIGHLPWSEIDGVQTPRTRHGLRRVQELHLDTDRGRASFELPGVSEDQLGAELEPLLQRFLRTA